MHGSIAYYKDLIRILPTILLSSSEGKLQRRLCWREPRKVSVNASMTSAVFFLDAGDFPVNSQLSDSAWSTSGLILVTASHRAYPQASARLCKLLPLYNLPPGGRSVNAVIRNMSCYVFRLATIFQSTPLIVGVVQYQITTGKSWNKPQQTLHKHRMLLKKRLVVRLI